MVQNNKNLFLVPTTCPPWISWVPTPTLSSRRGTGRHAPTSGAWMAMLQRKEPWESHVMVLKAFAWSGTYHAIHISLTKQVTWPHITSVAQENMILYVLG